MSSSPPTDAGYSSVEEGDGQKGEEIPEEESEQKSFMARGLGMSKGEGVEWRGEFFLGRQQVMAPFGHDGAVVEKQYGGVVSGHGLER